MKSNSRTSKRRAPQRQKRTLAAVAASLPPLPNPDDEQAFLDWLGQAKAKRVAAKAGKPWTAEEFLQIFLLAGTGMKLKSIAYCLGRSTSSLQSKFLSQIKWAVEAGRSKTAKEMSQLLIDSARKAKHDPKYLTALIFYLKTQCGWSERFTLAMESELKEMLQVGLPAQAVVGRLVELDSKDLRQLADTLQKIEGSKDVQQQPQPTVPSDNGAQRRDH